MTPTPSTQQPSGQGAVQPGGAAPGAADHPPLAADSTGPSRWARPFALRRNIPAWAAVLCSAACIALCYLAWTYVTAGEAEERIYSPLVLRSPTETFSQLDELWTKGKLALNTWISLRRVAIGFALAAAIGIPVGVLCGCFTWINAFFAPLTIFGRNVPMAALVPLTFALFGATTEKQKFMFIFLASVAFVISDTAISIRDVGGQYIDTAYTLGASRLQIILKVLVPLALPNIFNSLRLLFGLAFGYIMLAELVTVGNNVGGLGHIINLARSRGANPAFVVLILLLIPAVALGIDRLLFFIQRQLFPFRYGGAGWLNRGVGLALRGWERVKGFFWSSSPGDYPPPRRREAA